MANGHGTTQLIIGNPGTRQVDVWSSEDILGSCPSCDTHAIVELTERLKKLQPDGTTYVCHPGFGGCNQGFKLD